MCHNQHINEVLKGDDIQMDEKSAIMLEQSENLNLMEKSL